MNIDLLDNLPKRESRAQYITRTVGDMWDIPKFDHGWYRSDTNDYAHIKARRSIKKFLGKSFNNAFSSYCKKVEIHEQKKFFKEFVNITHTYRDYFVDDQGNIQSSNHCTTKNRPFVCSLDYKSGVYDLKEKCFIDRQWWEEGIRNNPRYEKRTKTGWIKYFDSRKDLEYKKLRRQADYEKKQLRNKELKDKRAIADIKLREKRT